MAITVSRTQSIPSGLEIVKEYGSITASGRDLNEALQALIDRANTLQKFKGANWIIGLAFAEIPGSTCTATGFAYDLESTGS